MHRDILLSLLAFACLLPAGILALRRHAGRGAPFWLTLALAAAGPVAIVVLRTESGWKTDVSTALWITIAATVCLFAVIAALSRTAARLAPVVLPYMAALALLATVWLSATEPPLATAPGTWLALHVAASVFTYAVATIAACAAFAAFVQERALKRKTPGAWTHALPSIADCDALQFRLLTIGEVVLGAGLLTGMAVEFLRTGQLLVLDHKIVFAIAAFVVIGVLLWLNRQSGLRGRRAARVVLVAYLLLTLAYPGVKFVSDVLLA